MNTRVNPGQAAAIPGYSRPAFRVLCLEDNARDQELVEETLWSEWPACEFVRAKTREEFESALERGNLDLILSDFTLPSYDGLSALALARQVRPDTPFLFVSGTLGEDRAVESLKSGATDYVLKGNLRRLTGAVRRALEEAEEREHRRAAEASLRESHERFRQMAENLNQVFWLLDAKRNELIYVSPAFEQIWGRKCDIGTETPASWLAAVHQTDYARVQESKAAQRGGAYDEEYRIVRPDGSVRWIRDRAYAIRNESGDIYRIVGTAEDITEKRELEKQLRQAQKMEAVGQLAGGIAHDFNNQMTIVRGSADLILMEAGGLNAACHEYLNQIKAATEKAADLTRQLLTFGRRQTIETQPLNLNELIIRLKKILGLLVGPGVHPHYHLGQDLPAVQADPGMIEHVLVNLALNAKDAMPAGGDLTFGTGRAHVSQASAHPNPDAHEGAFATIAVTDTGTGIRPEILSRIFEPFFTTKEPGKGTGLGLAMVYGIIKQHRGWVEVSSQLGRGSTFTIYLPVLTDTAMAPNQALPATVAKGGTESILLVEDDAGVKFVTQRALEASGYRVRTASSGAEALAQWRVDRLQISLLITDLSLPDGVSGRELAEQLLMDRPDLKVAFVSGYDHASPTGKDSMEPGSTIFLKKPYSIHSLLEIVRRHLDG